MSSDNCKIRSRLRSFWAKMNVIAEDRHDMQHSQTAQLPATAVDSNVIAQAVLAMALGLLIVGVVGFSHISAVHNAAHDVRHANAFPCH